MELSEIVNKQRAVYVRQLREFYENRKEGVKEVLLKYDSEEEQLLFNLSRMDYLVEINGKWKIEELSPDSYMNHPKVLIEFKNLTIELNPLFWHGCQFISEQKINEFSWLEYWTRKWIDEEDTFNLDSDGFTGAIHNVTKPEQTERGTEFTIDFGAAHEESFMELITLIEKQGINKVKIGSFDLIEE